MRIDSVTMDIGLPDPEPSLQAELMLDGRLLMNECRNT